jgi:hypothetical protein
MGVRPLFVVAASICAFASLGPYPPSPHNTGELSVPTVHWFATAFFADSLLAWTTLATLLLIPYEARTPSLSSRGAVVRGILWAAIISLGAMTKISFFYFILLIIPILFLIKVRINGGRYACVAITAFACSSVPTVIYLVRWGRPAFAYASGSSFGGVAEFYYVPLLEFLSNLVRESPGLIFSFLLTLGALI